LTAAPAVPNPPAVVAGFLRGIHDFRPFHPWEVESDFLQAVDVFTWDHKAVPILEFQYTPELFDVLEARDIELTDVLTDFVFGPVTGPVTLDVDHRGLVRLIGNVGGAQGLGVLLAVGLRSEVDDVRVINLGAGRFGDPAVGDNRAGDGVPGLMKRVGEVSDYGCFLTRWGTEIALFHLMVHDDRNVPQVALGQRYADGSGVIEIDQGLVVVVVECVHVNVLILLAGVTIKSQIELVGGVVGATK
jgi:hypothetical protein